MPESFDVIRSGNINSPIVPAEGFRGKPVTDFDKCTGCGICARVCPSSAIELYPVRVNEKDTKRIVIYLARCTFCAQCVDACPKNAITMTEEYFLSAFDKFADTQVSGIEGRREHEVIEEQDC